MKRWIYPPLMVFWVATACSSQPDLTDEASSAETNAPAPAVVGAISNVSAEPLPSTKSASALTRDSERGEKGARNVLLSFAAAIEQRKYDDAWSLLGPAAQQSWSKSAFRAMLADFDRPSVSISGGQLEGAAGSSYYGAPIAITDSSKPESFAHLKGEAVLRRVNDVDGTSEAERKWHFEKVTLEPISK